MSNQKNSKSNILPIAVMFLLFFMIAFVTNFAGSMGVIVKNQFDASNALAQLGTLANFIAYACMGIPAGYLLKRKGYKFTSLAAVSVGFVGVGIQWLSGYAESFGVYVLGAFIAGFSMCMLNVVVNPMLNTLGGGGKRGNQLCLLGGSCNSIGGTIAPILLGYLIGGMAEYAQVKDAAPAMIIAMAIFAFAFIVIFFTDIPEPHKETAEEREARLSGKIAKDTHSPLSFRHFVLGAVAIFFYVGVEVGLPNIANLYMTTWDVETARTTIDTYNQQHEDLEALEALRLADEAALAEINNITDKKAKKAAQEAYTRLVVDDEAYQQAMEVSEGAIKPGLGMKANVAGWFIGLYWLLMFIGRLIGGAIGGKVSSKTMLACVSCMGIVLLLCLMFMPATMIKLPFIDNYLPLNILFLILCGLCTSVMWGNIFNLAAEGLGKYTPAASGIFMALVCGGGILPFFQGLLADGVGYIYSYIIPIIALAYIFFYAVIGSKNVNTDIPTK